MFREPPKNEEERQQRKEAAKRLNDLFLATMTEEQLKEHIAFLKRMTEFHKQKLASNNKVKDSPGKGS